MELERQDLSDQEKAELEQMIMHISALEAICRDDGKALIVRIKASRKRLRHLVYLNFLPLSIIQAALLAWGVHLIMNADYFLGAFNLTVNLIGGYFGVRNFTVYKGEIERLTGMINEIQLVVDLLDEKEAQCTAQD